MGNIKYIFLVIRSLLVNLLKSKYKWMLFLYLIWLYRVEFVAADNGGLAKGAQVVTIGGMLLLVMRYKRGIINYVYNRTNVATQSLVILYTYALISTLWAFIPSFAFFLSLQNLVIICILVWLFLYQRSFKKMEQAFLIGGTSILLLESILCRIINGMDLFVHHLVTGSTSALLLSYCIAEIFNKAMVEKERERLLKGIATICVIILITSTSSGANASALFGFGVACLFSRKWVYAVMLLFVSVILYVYPEAMDYIMGMIMNGKSQETVRTANGRQYLWEILLKLAAQRPVLGWGYACIERAVTQQGFLAMDAHNNYLGIYGSLGIVGCVLFGYHLLVQTVHAYKNRARPGYLGLLCATCCAILNGYSYGFLSGKACSITVVYFMLVVLSFTYSRALRYE